MTTPTIKSAGSRLREAINAPAILVAPGAYDAISARLVEANGFEAVYVTGGGTTNAHLGLPDLGLMTMTEMALICKHIAASVSLPVFSDADTGYGNPLNVRRTVVEFERAGLAGLHIEDQAGIKRCGHLDGKSLATTKEMSYKIEAACEARSDPDFVIIARTDAAAVEGIAGAISRANAYADAGADVVFVEALHTRDDFARFSHSVSDIPLLANMTEFGRTEYLTAGVFQELGYAAVIFPMTSFRLMLRAIDDGLQALAAEGTQINLLDRMRTRDELYELLDYKSFDRLEARYSPSPDDLGVISAREGL